MAAKLTLGVDFGGSSSKATLLREDGRVIAHSTREYPSYHPFPGWYEQDADELYEALLFNIRAILRDSGADPADICAVALDAATHMAVLCDENDRPVRKFIHWSDSRSTDQAARLRRQNGALLEAHAFNAVSSAWTIAQLQWLRDNEPEILEKTRRIYFAKDYLRSRLTGDFCTDSIEIMGALLADDTTAAWSPELCALVGLDVSMLPEIKAPDAIAGTVTPEAAALTGLRAGTPVIVGTTDTVMEIYASGAVAPGDTTIKLATAGRICPITTGPLDGRHFYNYRHVVPGLWYPGTTTRTCAASFKWFKNTFCQLEAREAQENGESVYTVLDREAALVPPGSGDLFFHPWLQGEISPYNNDCLRASFTGVGINHGKSHFIRAVMEGVAYSMRDCMELIRAERVPVEQLRVIGGGARSELWRQILSDVLDRELCSTVENDSSLGSAMLAGTAVGMFDGHADSVAKCVRRSGMTRPDPARREIYERGYERYREISRAMLGLYEEP